MTESESVALPFGDSPLFICRKVEQKRFCIACTLTIIHEKKDVVNTFFIYFPVYTVIVQEDSIPSFSNPLYISCVLSAQGLHT